MITDLYQKFSNSTGVCTDSRKIARGNMFFALKGPNYDANEYAADALNKGAAFAVIDDPKFRKDDQFVVVDDTLKTLQELAIFHRNNLEIPFLAITGSNGKTTTKELINAVLSQGYNTFATMGNLNNHIGVPLTVLGITPKIELAIIEMGANKIGDIAELCEIAKPTHGIITNIGKAHIEGFGSFEGVIRGKSELYDYLFRHNGTAFINSQNPILAKMGKRFEQPVYYPSKGDYFSCRFVKADPFVTYENESGEIVETNLVGSYNFENIAAALCIGKYFKIIPDKAKEAVVGYVPSNNRSQVTHRKNNTILLDAYNANPSSMKAAIENLAGMKAEKKAVILGDMFELGSSTEEEHRNIGKVVDGLHLDRVYFCGKHMKWASEACQGANYFESKAGLKEHLKTHPVKGYVVLIKASRGMALEDIVEAIE
jgi:UDP-N-acetylmuramoyl-tripeptide--D-alanyl-D-alanine ligase